MIKKTLYYRPKKGDIYIYIIRVVNTITCGKKRGFDKAKNEAFDEIFGRQNDI